MSCHPRYPVADAAATADDADSISPDETHSSPPLSSSSSDKEDEISATLLSSASLDEDSDEEDEIPSPPLSSSSLDEDSNEEGEIPSPPLSSPPLDEDSSEEDEMTSPPPLEDDASNGVSAPPQESGVSLDASTSEPQCGEASCIEDSVDSSSPGTCISSPSLPAFFEFISSIHCVLPRSLRSPDMVSDVATSVHENGTLVEGDRDGLKAQQ